MNKTDSDVRVLAFSGSPHRDGVVEHLIERVLDGARKEVAETELVRLYDLRIEPAPGHYSIDPAKETVENMPDDDMVPLYGKIAAADILVFGTPVYWANMSGVMKTLIDRLTPLENDRFSLCGKVAVCIAASKENEGGLELAALNLVSAVTQMGALIPPGGVLWAPGDWSTAQGDVPSWAERDAPLVGGDAVKMVRLFKQNDFRWGWLTS